MKFIHGTLIVIGIALLGVIVGGLLGCKERRATKRLLAFAALAMTSLPSTAHAIDCARASSPVEHIICGDQKLVRADAALNGAYATILKAAPDPAIRAMLVTSQKRRIAARESAFGDLDRATNGQTGENYPKTMQRSLVLHAIQDRTQGLEKMSDRDPKQPHLIQVALAQRRAASTSGFTGGPFAGFATECFFYPGHPDGSGDRYGYSCVGTVQYQNDDRVCSETGEWATYRLYTSRAAATLVAGAPKVIASCKQDNCFGDGVPGTGWTTGPDAAKDATILTPPPPLPKLDAEVDGNPGGDEVEPWLKACLTDSRFPKADSDK